VRSLKLKWRGPLLIAFPLLCQALFLVAVIAMLSQVQVSLEKTAHMREILLRLNHTCTRFCDSLMFETEKFRDPSAASAQAGIIRDMDSLLKSLPEEQTAGMRKTMLAVNNVIYLSATLMSRPGYDKRVARAEIFKRLFVSLPEFLTEIKKVIEINDKLRMEEIERCVQIKDSLLNLITTTIYASITIAVVLFFIFTISIKRPIQHISNNSFLLSKRKPLLAALQGDDELSRLDRSLHQTLDAVLVGTEREFALINNVADLVCSLNQEGVFIESNAAAVKVLGISSLELKGKSIADVVIPNQSLLAEEYLRKATMPGEVSNFELQLQTAGGEVLETQWSATWSPLRKLFFCVVRDITTEKALARMKQDFVDMVSHDLRSPLTSLGITLEMIEKGALGELNPLAMKEVQATSKNVHTLITFINDLLDFQKLDEGRVHLDKSYCSTHNIVKDAIALTQDVADSRKITIHYEPLDFEVYCDQTKMTQAMLNLLSNAIKFSPSEDKVSINIKIEDKQQVSFVRIEVSDNGPGIPDDLKQRIFEPFEQAPLHKNQGTGLGLAICKMVVESHGGAIGVRDKEDGGSLFWFTIPTSDAEPVKADNQSADGRLFLD
jgi:PAS domain S-box-containing protein